MTGSNPIPIQRLETVPLLAIEDNANAIAFGDEAVVVMLEARNTSGFMLASAGIQAVGYDLRGYIIAMEEVGRLTFWPCQTRGVRLLLRPLSGSIAVVGLFTDCNLESVGEMLPG